jgi:hypothetical protein
VFFGWGHGPAEYACDIHDHGEWDFGHGRPLPLEDISYERTGDYSGMYPLLLLVSIFAATTLWLFWRTRSVSGGARSRNLGSLRVWRVGLLLLLLLFLSAFWLPGAMVAAITIALLWRGRKRAAGTRSRNPRLVPLRRMSVAVLLLLLCMWVFSTRFFVELLHGEAWLDSTCGIVTLGLRGDNGSEPWEPAVGVRGNWCDGFDRPYFFHDPPTGSYGDEYYAGCPFWLPVSVVGVATIWLYRRTRGYPEGQCHACGYNLTGNTSGVCPECGVAMEADARATRATGRPA